MRGDCQLFGLTAFLLVFYDRQLGFFAPAIPIGFGQCDLVLAWFSYSQRPVFGHNRVQPARSDPSFFKNIWVNASSAGPVRVPITCQSTGRANIFCRKASENARRLPPFSTAALLPPPLGQNRERPRSAAGFPFY